MEKERRNFVNVPVLKTRYKSWGKIEAAHEICDNCHNYQYPVLFMAWVGGIIMIVGFSLSWPLAVIGGVICAGCLSASGIGLWLSGKCLRISGEELEKLENLKEG